MVVGFLNHRLSSKQLSMLIPLRYVGGCPLSAPSVAAHPSNSLFYFPEITFESLRENMHQWRNIEACERDLSFIEALCMWEVCALQGNDFGSHFLMLCGNKAIDTNGR
ncbi:uncharacterized protein [Henckelia pumila]|uniref:uncharacterized protein isoform X2 n=1 Tax=Henckelia pumila TaxID=405737 RepID=UPI003C6E0BCE